MNGALIFDYSRYLDIDNHEIRLPKNAFRQLKIVISGIADAKESPLVELTRKYRGGSESERIEKTRLERRPFRMDRIELWRERSEAISQQEQTAGYAARVSRVEEATDDNGGKSTIVYVGTRREPIAELTVETSSRNFSRQARVQTAVRRGRRTEWVDVAAGRVSSVDFGGYRSESLSLHLPEQRENEYRIVIRNDDNPPLVITGVGAKGGVYRAVFLAAAKEHYRLAYGSDDARQPSYDAAAVIEPLRIEGRRPIEARLGGEVRQSGVAASAPSAIGNLLNDPVVLGALIVVLVALLGWALFRATQRINRLPKE